MQIGSRLIRFRNPIKVFRLPTQITWGITNRTVDGYYLVFGDYDLVEYDVVKQDADFLQKNFNIGPIMTRVSSHQSYKDDVEVGSFHLFSFTKWTFPEAVKLVNLLRCERNFKRGWWYQQRCLVLRLGEKVNREGIVEKPSTVMREVITGGSLSSIHTAQTKASPSSKQESSSASQPKSQFSYNALVEYFERLDDVSIGKYIKEKDNSTIQDVEHIKYVTRSR